ncbi:hypothetical protein LCGC14_3155680 [marine sediment metagenome]|uniref:Uncharacterized protein n=1 Tax=marine sediment metagenome TaxID=412755 RepID=A0A0F8YHA4_9ZZZZ
MITSIIGWIGVACIVACNFPQLISALKYGCKVRVHKTTYSLLLIGIACHLVLAIAIGEPVFIASNTISFICIGVVRWKLRT